MLYEIDAVQPTGAVTLATLTDVSEWEAFTVWEELVMDAHNGYEIDRGHAGWVGLNAGDVIRLNAYTVQDGVMEPAGILYQETNSARANRRRTN